MQSLSGPITSSGCASADLAEGLFQTRQPTQYCEWRNGVIGRDAVCYCGTNECNAKELLENWIQNGGECKLFLIILRNKKKSKRSKVMWQVGYYFLVKKPRLIFKMHSASEKSELVCLKNQKRKIWTKKLKFNSQNWV